jgi:hypothetical protein
LDKQPIGNRPFKLISPKDQRLMVSQCRNALAQKLISQEANDFLTGWVTSTLNRVPRPVVYKYLAYRWQEPSAREHVREAIPYDLAGEANRLRIVVHAVADDAMGIVDFDMEVEAPDVAPLDFAEER